MRLLEKFLHSSRQGFTVGAVFAGVVGSAVLERIVNPIIKKIVENISFIEEFKPFTDFIVKYFNSILIFSLIVLILILLRKYYFVKSDFKKFKIKMQDIIGDELKSIIFYNKYLNSRFSVKDCRMNSSGSTIIELFNDIGPDLNSMPFSVKFEVSMPTKQFALLIGTCIQKNPWLIEVENNPNSSLLLQYTDIENDFIIKIQKPENASSLNYDLALLTGEFND